MAKNVLMPDGTEIEFPDDMTPEQITQVIGTEIMPQAAATPTWKYEPSAELKLAEGMEKVASVLPSQEQITGTGLPLGGMMAGSAVMAPLGPFGMVAGAGLGGGVGKGLGDVANWFTGKKPAGTMEEQAESVGQGALEGVTGEMLGGPVAAIVGKVVAPFAGKLSEATQTLIAKAQKDNWPLSIDVLNPNKFTKGLQWLVDQVPPGSLLTARFRGKLNEKLLQARNDFVEEGLKMESPQSVVALKQEGKEVFEQMVGMAGGNKAEYPMTALASFLKANQRDAPAIAGKALKDELQQAWKKIAKDEPLSFGEINNILSKGWGKNYGKASPEDTAWFAGLQDALATDMQTINQITGRQVYETMLKGRGLYKSSHEAANARVIENMLDRSTIYNEKTDIFSFKPYIFAKEVKRLQPVLERIFKKDPDRLNIINEFADEMVRVATDVSRRTARTGGAPLMRDPRTYMELATVGGAIAAMPALAVPAGFETWMAYSLMNPKGWMKRWLTEGLMPGASKLSKEVTRALVIDSEEQESRDQ